MTHELSHPNLLPDLNKLTLRRAFHTDQGWVVEADGQDCAPCARVANTFPARATAATGAALRDLPVQGTPVSLRLRRGRWRCRNPECQRRIFTERLSGVCAP